VFTVAIHGGLLDQYMQPCFIHHPHLAALPLVPDR
jgi:hypothetical protein